MEEGADFLAGAVAFAGEGACTGAVGSASVSGRDSVAFAASGTEESSVCISMFSSVTSVSFFFASLGIIVLSFMIF